MNEQPLNLRASLQEIWRRRLLVIVVAALCGLAGFAYGLLRPVEQTSLALVLLPQSGASNSGNSGNTGTVGNTIATEAVIARSASVLAAAGAKVSPPLGALAVKKLVTVTPLSGQILQFQAQGPTSRYAMQLANALATSYVDYVGQLQKDSAKAAVTALQQESSQLTQQIKDLQSEMSSVSARIALEGTGSSQGQQDTSQLSSLQSEQNQASLELSNVTNQITNANIENGSAVSTTRVLQTATVQPSSRYRFPIETSIIGFVLGGLCSAVIVLLRLQRGHRLRFRDEIARAAGAPVIASLDAPNCTTVSAWRDLLAEREPASADEWPLRHLLHSLLNSSNSRQAVRVISFAGDAPALATGPRLALHAAASGIQTALVSEDGPMSEDRSLKHLRAAFTSSVPVDRGLPLTLGLNETIQDLPEMVVSLVVFHSNSTILTQSEAVNLLSISSKVVTDEEVAHFALQAGDSGLVLEGIVVVNPDPSDNATGFTRKDTVRLLPSHASADNDDPDLVHLARPTRETSGRQGRNFRQEG
jgi:capsular polysaccharide biosynthesis protein